MEIDIRPDDESIVITLKKGGVVPVVIFSQPNFDVNTIIVDSIRLAGAPVKSGKREDSYSCSFADFSSDGIDDIECQILVNEMQLETGEYEVELTARTSSGVSIQGTDMITANPGK